VNKAEVGEWVEPEFMFGHDRDWKDASVTYGNSKAGDRPFVLRPVSRKTEPKEGVPSYPGFVSTVVPREQVDTADLHTPGTYGLAENVFETYSGNGLWSTRRAATRRSPSQRS
jgi:hypothetical protein